MAYDLYFIRANTNFVYFCKDSIRCYISKPVVNSVSSFEEYKIRSIYFHNILITEVFDTLLGKAEVIYYDTYMVQSMMLKYSNKLIGIPLQQFGNNLTKYCIIDLDYDNLDNVLMLAGISKIMIKIGNNPHLLYKLRDYKFKSVYLIFDDIRYDYIHYLNTQKLVIDGLTGTQTICNCLNIQGLEVLKIRVQSQIGQPYILMMSGDTKHPTIKKIIYYSGNTTISLA